MLLTIPIGLVSSNLPLSTYAQNRALSQTRNEDDAEGETEQSQSSEQNGQVISGYRK